MNITYDDRPAAIQPLTLKSNSPGTSNHVFRPSQHAGLLDLRTRAFRIGLLGVLRREWPGLTRGIQEP